MNNDVEMLDRVKEIKEELDVSWHPLLGKKHEKKDFVAYSLERGQLRSNEPCFHIFPKRGNHLARAMNLGSDEYIGKKIIDALEPRYGQGKVSVLFFGRYSKNYKVSDPAEDPSVHGGCFCVSYEENPFTASLEYQQESLDALSSALSE